MIIRVLRATILLAALVLVTDVSVHNPSNDYDLGAYIYENVPEVPPDVANEEYIRNIHSMINAYRGGRLGGGRLVIETNALIDTKYKTWKRNADLINSLLALPKGMNDAGR